MRSALTSENNIKIGVKEIGYYGCGQDSSGSG
jgi:hypothetical protein